MLFKSNLAGVFDPQSDHWAIEFIPQTSLGVINNAGIRVCYLTKTSYS